MAASGMTGQGSSLKRRESTAATREGDQLIITPLGAGSEVGRSCVYMSYKGKIVLVGWVGLGWVAFSFEGGLRTN